MRCEECWGGVKEEAPCVCDTQRELADTPDTGTMEERFLRSPLDPRDEYRHAEDFNPPAWAERYGE